MSGIDGKAALAEMIENLGDLPEVRAIAAYVAELEAIKACAQNWCDAVDRDASWDGWDHHFKEMKYTHLEDYLE